MSTTQNYTFSYDEIEKLKEYRDKQNDARLKCRFIALILLAETKDIHIAISAIGKKERTITNWLKMYIERGIESLNSFQYKPKQCYLKEAELSELKAWVEANNPSNTKVVRDFIKKQFRIKYSLSAVEKILKKKRLKISAS